jgi:hypothetical protein
MARAVSLPSYGENRRTVGCGRAASLARTTPRSSAARVNSAERANARPASVSSTRRPPRTSSCAPTLASSWRTAMLSAGWPTNSASAARVKLWAAVTARK